MEIEKKICCQQLKLSLGKHAYLSSIVSTLLMRILNNFKYYIKLALIRVFSARYGALQRPQASTNGASRLYVPGWGRNAPFWGGHAIAAAVTHATLTTATIYIYDTSKTPMSSGMLRGMPQSGLPGGYGHSSSNPAWPTTITTQGGGTPMFAVLRSPSSVKVHGQAKINLDL